MRCNLRQSLEMHVFYSLIYFKALLSKVELTGKLVDADWLLPFRLELR